MSRPDISNNGTSSRLVQFILICLLFIGIGVFLGWWNYGDIILGLKNYATSIIVMVVGVGLIFSKHSEKLDRIGTAVLVSGLILMLTGIRFA